jgi:hypothetical protein
MIIIIIIMMIRGIKSSLVKLILTQINSTYSINIICCLWEAGSFPLEEKKSSVYVPMLLRFNINFYQNHDNF